MDAEAGEIARGKEFTVMVNTAEEFPHPPVFVTVYVVVAVGLAVTYDPVVVLSPAEGYHV